jgi:hypothetical protein
MAAAMVGITKVAIMVESKNLARKDHGVFLAFIPFFRADWDLLIWR